MASRESFDYIVVGGGAAGCVVASRLAEARSGSVLLLEAGPDRRLDTPSGLRDGWGLNRDFYWSISSEPDVNGMIHAVPRCRILGGTSWVTRFAYRGSHVDFQEWSDMGNPGWSSEDTLPFFNKLETDIDYGSEDWHGSDGPLPVTRYLDEERSEVHQAAVDALERLGFDRVDDHNRPGAVGVGRMPMNSIAGRRVSAVDAYLQHVADELIVRGEVVVNRILFNHDEAVGVELSDGTTIQAGRVVVSAGVFGSPALLMRSGVGHPDDLLSLGINPIVGLPGVGQGLGDHPGTDFDLGHVGEGRQSPILNSIATFHSKSAPVSGSPDLMLWLADPVAEEDGSAWFGVDVVLLKPEARGSLRISSADPTQQPRVYLPEWRHGVDLDRLVEGYGMAFELSQAPELKRFCRPPTRSRLADDELRTAIAMNSWSTPHFVGTCTMGPVTNPLAVVDENGRVHGTKRLWVIDASIIPIVPSGFTHLPTLMVAERLSSHLTSTQFPLSDSLQRRPI